jgi:surfeit locus 1 family protein
MPVAASSIRLWLVMLAALVVASSTFSLGQWQLRRAAQKEALQAAISGKNTLPALDNRALAATKNIAAELHRPAVVTGTWQAARTVFLDNRPMNGKPGFWVVTPLALAGTDQVIIVQRGWVPRDFLDRTRLPAIDTPAGTVELRGRIALPPSKLYEFSGEPTGRIRQNLDLDAYRRETGLKLLPVAIVQLGGPSEGLLREWAAPNLGVEKHYGYAFQWFGLCALVVGLLAWFQVRPWWNRRTRPTR